MYINDALHHVHISSQISPEFQSKLVLKTGLKEKDEKLTTLWILVRILLVKVDVCTKGLFHSLLGFNKLLNGIKT